MRHTIREAGEVEGVVAKMDAGNHVAVVGRSKSGVEKLWLNTLHTARDQGVTLQRERGVIEQLGESFWIYGRVQAVVLAVIDPHARATSATIGWQPHKEVADAAAAAVA